MNRKRRPALITGLGIVSPYGTGNAAFHNGITSRRSAISSLTLFEPTGSCERAAEVMDADYASAIFSTQPYVDRTTALAIIAARICLDQAGISLPLQRETTPPVGVIMGSAWGCMNSIERFSEPILAGNGRNAQGLIFSHSFANSPASLIAIEFGLHGFSTVFSGSRLAGLWAIHSALGALQNRQAERLLVGCAESLSLSVMTHFQDQGWLTTRDLPAAGTDGADGTILGEGAVFLLLESQEAAEARGSTILAQLSSCTLGGGLEAHRSLPKPAPGNRFCCATGIPELDRREALLQQSSKENPLPTLVPLLGDALSVNPLYALAAALHSGGGPSLITQADETDMGCLLLALP